jgi:hypothetical protein
MADKRMFSLQIVDSDAFLDLPSSAQALYFHLGMRADDDGFLNNARTIARIVGSGNKDLELLIEKRFIYMFEGGVSVIKHWKVNNYIAKDRYKKTMYTDIFKQLEVKENNSYTLCIQNVDNLYTQSSIDKVSIDKVSIDNTIVQPKVEPKKVIKDSYLFEESFQRFWEAYPKKVGKGNVEKWFKKNRPSQDLVDNMIQAIEDQKLSKQWQDVQYIPLPATWLNQARWGDELPVSELAYAKKEEERQIDIMEEMEKLTRLESMRIHQEVHSKNIVEVDDEELDDMLNNLDGLAKDKSF